MPENGGEAKHARGFYDQFHTCPDKMHGGHKVFVADCEHVVDIRRMIGNVVVPRDGVRAPSAIVSGL